MTAPIDPDATVTAWILQHLWAPLMAVIGGGMAAIWSQLNRRLDNKVTRQEVNGLGERVSRAELDLERRRMDIQKLFDEDDKLRDHMDVKVDQVRSEMQTGFRDLSALITSHIIRNGNGDSK